MKKQSHFYTAQEILQIIDKAHAVGITTIKIPGFEAEWRIPGATSAPRTAAPAQSSAPAKVRVEQGVQPVPSKRCLACNRELKANGKIGNLCVTCYRHRHSMQVEDYGNCSRCDGPLQLGRTSGEPYCQPCWTRKRDGGK